MPFNSWIQFTKNSAPGLGDLRGRLVWLTLFRLVANTLSLTAILWRIVAERPLDLSNTDIGALVAIATIYAVTLAYSVRLKQGRSGRGDAIVQVTGDVLIATALVFLTGGPESPFTFTYSVAVIGAALVLGFRAALWSSAASLLMYGGVALLVQWRVLVPPMGGEVLPLPRLTFLLVTHSLAVTLVGTLAGYLSGQLAQTGGRLVESQRDLLSLAGLHAQILDAMPSGLVTTSPQRRITFANPTALTILSMKEWEVLDQAIEDLMPGVSALGGSATRRELHIETPAGRKVLGLSVAPLEAEPGADLLVFQDLTDLRRLEQKLNRADRLAALGQMAAQLAHEIRNPLAAMRGSAQMIEREAQGNDIATRLTQILVRESDRLARLVEEVLRFSRPPEPNRQDVAMDALIEETVMMLRADVATADVLLETETIPHRAWVDPDQLRQVLLNLARNAVQEVGADGRVAIRLERDEEAFRVTVWDSAGAITPATMGRMFEPFFSTRKGGTGLGLATAHAIVRAHGGELEVHSSPEAGTEFVARIPTQPAPQTLTPLPETAELRTLKATT